MKNSTLTSLRSILGRMSMQWRLLRRGRFRFAAHVERNMWWGVLHDYCIQCGKTKPRDGHRQCGACSFFNLLTAIEDELGPEENEEEVSMRDWVDRELEKIERGN